MLKVSPNLSIGAAELRRAFRGIKEDGYQLLFSSFVKSFGVSLATANSLKVDVGSNGGRWLRVRAGIAVDKNLNLIYLPQDADNVVQFPNAPGSYFLNIAHAIKNTEVGTVAVNTDGSIIGTGTKFTEVLRGAPLNQVKMRFPSSANNLNDYPVLEVIDDTHATLNNVTSLTAESGLQYAVVGNFTPGVSVPDANKLIYEYDHYTVTLSNSAVYDGTVFKLARVNWDGSTLTIEDLRTENQLALYDTTADLVQQITNSVITAYNLQITTQFAQDLQVINTQLAALTANDTSFASQLATLTAQMALKANSTQEAWTIVDGGAPAPSLGVNWDNSLGGDGRTKFMKTTTGTVFVHIYVKCTLDAPFGNIIFTLPAGYHPTAQITLMASKWTETGFPSGPVWLSINTNGQVFYSESADFPQDDHIQVAFSFQTTL